MAMPDDAPTPFDQGLFLVHLNRGKELFGKRNFSEAASEFDQALRMRPTDQSLLNLLGLAHFKQEKYREAERIYGQLIKLNPDSDVLHFNLGLVCFKLGALDRAEASFLRALEIAPDNAKVSFYLGNIYEKKKQYYNAIFQYRKAGANIMVKRVQAKIESARHAQQAAGEEATPAGTEDTLPPPPPRRTPARAAPPPGTGTGEADKITVDHIDRQRFLSALQQAPLGGPRRGPRAKGQPTLGADTQTTGPPVESSPLAARTVVELTEPVVPDVPLGEMARGKVPTPAAPSLFATPTPPAPPPPPAEDEDTVKFASAPHQDLREPVTRPLQRSALVSEEDKETTDLYSRLRRRDDIFRYLENNLMEVNFSGKVFIKQGSIYSYSGNLTFWVKPQRGEAASPLVIVSGTGKLLLSDRQREITVLQVDGEEVFVEPSHLLACQETLTPRYAMIKKEDASGARLQVLCIEGSGMLALSVATSPLVINVTPGYPVNVSSANIISWAGELSPTIVDDEALADLMYPHRGRAVNLRLEGSGKVMVEKLRR